MPRPPLPIGTWGAISTRATKTNKNGKPIKHLAHAKFRDHDGKVRPVTAVGTTRSATRAALLTQLQNRAKTNHSGELTAAHKVNHLLDLWDKKFQGLVADGTRSPTSLDTDVLAMTVTPVRTISGTSNRSPRDGYHDVS